MGYAWHTVLVDTYDYSAVSWEDMRDQIRNGVSDSLWDWIKGENVIAVMRELGFIARSEKEPAPGGYRADDYEAMRSLLDDLNNAQGVVVIEKETRQDYMEYLMEQAGI